jgi:hypothetical protein
MSDSEVEYIDEEIIQEEVALEEIFTKFKYFNIDILLVLDDESTVKVNPRNKKYVDILTALFDDSCDLISDADLEILLDQFLNIFDKLDDEGFSGGVIKIPVNVNFNHISVFIDKL